MSTQPSQRLAWHSNRDQMLSRRPDRGIIINIHIPFKFESRFSISGSETRQFWAFLKNVLSVINPSLYRHKRKFKTGIKTELKWRSLGTVFFKDAVT